MTTISDLPKNLVEKILCRVPITCLGAVRSTCKRWNALSKVKILCKAETRQQFLGFMMKKFKLCSVRYDLNGALNEEGVEEFVEPSIKELGNLPNEVEISKIFQCDGLVLCATRDHTRLVVWNPYLGQTRWIEPSTAFHSLDRYAMGYDKNRKHKILRFLDDDVDLGQHVLGYEIYDFSSNSWRALDIAPTWDIEFFQRGASLKGNIYFLAKDKMILVENEWLPVPEDYLLCFDFTTETFGHSLPLPFKHYCDCAGALSSLRDEKLAALYQGWDRSDVEIWVTTMIHPNAVSWTPFLKLDLIPHAGVQFQFVCTGGSFFIDEEKKLAVVFHFEDDEITRYEDAAYIIGEDGYFKKVRLGEAPVNQQGSLDFSEYADCCPLLCCRSYVPTLVQINQIAGFKKERDDEEAYQQAQRRRLTDNNE